METSLKLRFPKKSHRKVVSYPAESIRLAELMGIVFGDGGINNSWQVVVSMNSISDRAYSSYVASLFKELFAIDVRARTRPPKKVLLLICSSINLVDFLVSKGAVRGNKIAQQFDAPEWILSNNEYRKYFVRGLVDTDGCLYVHRHTVANKPYANIGFCFSSYSPPLLATVGKIISAVGITPHFSKDGWKIYLYGRAVKDYLRIFGSSNSRITNKYSSWEAERAATDHIVKMPRPQ